MMLKSLTLVYLVSCIDSIGGSESDIQRIELTHCYMKALDCNIWYCGIKLQTKIRLYNVYCIYS